MMMMMTPVVNNKQKMFCDTRQPIRIFINKWGHIWLTKLRPQCHIYTLIM